MKSNAFDGTALQTDQEREARAKLAFWSMLKTWYRWRRFIFFVTAGMAVAAVVIALLLPNWYLAATRLLPPERGTSSSLASALGGDLASAASALLGGPSGDYARYLSILSSRSMMSTVVDSFDLVQVYDLADDRTPRESAIKRLEENVDFILDKEYDFLSVQVLDRDPQRAAAMANLFVRELNRVNAQLASKTAGNYRQFAEERYNEARASLDSVLSGIQSFQEQYGVLDLPAQAQSFFEQVAALRANAIAVEVQAEALRQQFGPDNMQVQQLEDLARLANQKYANALQGEEKLLPVAQAQFPTVARAYVELERERLIQMRILEIIGPLYEQARFEEERKVEAVQVVDEAVPPARKAQPKRSVIVIAATLSAFILALLFSIIYTWWQRNHRAVIHQLRQVTDEPARPDVLQS